MNVMIIRRFGGPEVLEKAELPRPEPGAGDVLVRVRAASVNPVDYKIRSGSYTKMKVDLPAVLGRDVSGVVEALGSGVTGYRVGDEVFAFLGKRSGGYAEYALAKEQEVAKKPSTLDHVHAAAVPLAGITAWQALFDHGGLTAGQRVLIHGGAGGVGHLAVQFAKAKGATVFATCGTDDVGFVKDLGADTVIDYKTERFETRVSDIDLVVDLIAGETQDRSWQVLKRGGRLISTLQPPSEERARQAGVTAKAFMAEPRHDQLVEIARLIDQGKVRVKVQRTVPLPEVPSLHQQLEHDHSVGKSVLTVG